jgi:hypothetical protein
MKPHEKTTSLIFGVMSSLIALAVNSPSVTPRFVANSKDNTVSI